ncbi:hypothetical protein E2C01_033495 [Portunus trituberculatus]|uniref:Uncharacterized protein n=1 Tax=Portunus trituberculatus TaxID=210409 RepID=A0A5B7F095_PORTR|nr:hypothetical protein [Portunus trituberculatus]
MDRMNQLIPEGQSKKQRTINIFVQYIREHLEFVPEEYQQAFFNTVITTIHKSAGPKENAMEKAPLARGMPINLPQNQTPKRTQTEPVALAPQPIPTPSQQQWISPQPQPQQIYYPYIPQQHHPQQQQGYTQPTRVPTPSFFIERSTPVNLPNTSTGLSPLVHTLTNMLDMPATPEAPPPTPGASLDTPKTIATEFITSCSLPVSPHRKDDKKNDTTVKHPRCPVCSHISARRLDLFVTTYLCGSSPTPTDFHIIVAVSATPDSITTLSCHPFFTIVLVGVALQNVFFSTHRRPGLHKYRVQLPKISGSPRVRGSGCPYCMLAGKRMRHVPARPLYIPLVHIRHSLEWCMCNNHASFHVMSHAHVRSLRNNTASYPQQHHKLPATHRNHSQEAVPCRMKPRHQKPQTPRHRRDTAQDTPTLPQQHGVTHCTKTRDAAQ